MDVGYPGVSVPSVDGRTPADIAFDVLLETSIYIQPLPIWEDEWAHPEKHSNPRLLENIQREGIPV